MKLYRDMTAEEREAADQQHQATLEEIKEAAEFKMAIHDAEIASRIARRRRFRQHNHLLG